MFFAVYENVGHVRVGDKVIAPPSLPTAFQVRKSTPRYRIKTHPTRHSVPPASDCISHHTVNPVSSRNGHTSMARGEARTRSVAGIRDGFADP